MKKTVQILIVSALVLGAALFAVSLVPGDFSLLGTVKSAANRLVADGDFESIDLTFYNRLRMALAAGGLGLLLPGAAALWAARAGKSRLAGGLAALLGVGYGLAALAGASLAIQRLNSPVYRTLAGAPLSAAFEFTPPTATPTPRPTSTPVPTLAFTEPGEWVLLYDGLDQPLIVTNAGDGSGRLFIGEKRGRIRIFRNGLLEPEPFLDISDRVLQEWTGEEQGFLGLVFHPNYAENGYFYVNYIDLDGHTVVSRFQVTPANPDRADRGSETKIIGVSQPSPQHNAGHLAFGPDGFLYIAFGDGGPQEDPLGNAQSLNTLLGKIVRIDVDGGDPYAIPPGNPFVGAFGRDEIWAMGLRNPWRFSFDALTGDLFIGDVGHRESEEIDFLPAGHPPGANFGWNYFEGMRRYQHAPGDPDPALTFVDPIWEFLHGTGYCSVTGGIVYRGEALPELQGTYLYADYCQGTVWGLRQVGGGWENLPLFDTEWRIASFGVDENHELYIVGLGGILARLEK